MKQEEKDKYLYYLSKIAPYFYKYHLQKRVAIIGVAQIATALGKFLEQRFGQIIQTVIITDGHSEQEKKEIESRFKKGTKIQFSEDGKEIDTWIKEAEPEVILGSQLEDVIAKELQVPNLHISLPNEKKVILAKSLIGVAGILSFLEEYSNAVIE